ncbi:MAG TPA: TfoX/Sxy family protein [Myxococcales bacterium]|nr:TfoX/Sxy family protein [Myxococcales bacterium]
MANTPSFVQHSLDLFAPLGEVTARRLFGGHGLYQGGIIFGLLDDGELFLKTDDLCRPAFKAAGGTCWTYPSPEGPMETSYFRPPAEALEDADSMRKWFDLAVAASRRAVAKKKKPARKQKPAKKKKR